MPALECHAVDAARWGDFARLFSSRGAPGHCWCMAWRRLPPGSGRGEAGREARKEALKEAMRGRVAAGVPIGILGYRDGEPVAWCSIAPRETYRPLGGPPDDPSADASEEVVWSLVCFFVPRRLRGQGWIHELIDAAVAHAASRGATVVEAYPVDPDSPSYRFGGFVATFAAAGFEEVGRAGSRRHVMRRHIES